QELTAALISGNFELAQQILSGMTDEIDEAADYLAEVFSPFVAESIADSIQEGLENGLARGARAFLESGDLTDLTLGVQQGLYDSVTTALVNSLINSAIIRGALGGYLTEISEAFAAGDTERAAQLTQE